MPGCPLEALRSCLKILIPEFLAKLSELESLRGTHHWNLLKAPLLILMDSWA